MVAAVSGTGALAERDNARNVSRVYQTGRARVSTCIKRLILSRAETKNRVRPIRIRWIILKWTVPRTRQLPCNACW